MDQSDKYLAEIIENGISSTFWKEYLVPMLEEEIARYKKMLVDCNAEDFRPLQERARYCRELLKRPAADLKKSKGG